MYVNGQRLTPTHATLHDGSVSIEIPSSRLYATVNRSDAELLLYVRGVDIPTDARVTSVECRESIDVVGEMPDHVEQITAPDGEYVVFHLPIET